MNRLGITFTWSSIKYINIYIQINKVDTLYVHATREAIEEKFVK